MTYGLHSLAKPRGQGKGRRVGRGHGSGRGTTAGRGQKGQRARTGGRRGNRRRTIKQLISHLPKLKGFHSRRIKVDNANLEQLGGLATGTAVTLELMRQRGLIGSGRIVKIIGNKKIKPALTVQAHRFSVGARRAITEAGGQVVIIPVPVRSRPHRRTV